MVLVLIVGLKKRISLYKMSYFSEPYTRSKSKIKVELDFSNYATKSDLKNETGVDKLKFAKKANLASFKSDTDKLDIDKLEKVTSGLNILKIKVNKLDVDELKLIPTD